MCWRAPEKGLRSHSFRRPLSSPASPALARVAVPRAGGGGRAPNPAGESYRSSRPAACARRPRASRPQTQSAACVVLHAHYLPVPESRGSAVLARVQQGAAAQKPADKLPTPAKARGRQLGCWLLWGAQRSTGWVCASCSRCPEGSMAGTRAPACPETFILKHATAVVLQRYHAASMCLEQHAQVG